MYDNRKELYKELESRFEGKVLAYITGDKPGYETRIAQDVIDIFIKHLEKIGPVKRMLLYLYTRGGDVAAAWNIVNLLRIYCDELIVIIPHKAHSSGTIISLGANKIIMTKQATLSPIDPSLDNPLNPIAPNNTTVQVSVEAVKGYIELAKTEFGISSDETLGKILLNLSERVHPLVLGQVYRTRGQIKRIAVKLLENQVSDKEQVEKITEFLCSDSGSHDYTINRREAKNELKLNVDKPSDEEYRVIKCIYDDFAEELGFEKEFIFSENNQITEVKRGFIESLENGSDYFATDVKTSIYIDQHGKRINNKEHFNDGWRHLNEKIQSVEIANKDEGIKYECDKSNFKL